MDLVRAILKACEEEVSGYPPAVPTIDGYDKDQVAYHIHLMGDAGLLRVADTTAIGSASPSAAILSVTWKGYDFLEAATSSDTWQVTKIAVSRIGGASLDVWIEVMKFYAKQKLKDIGIDLPG
jgi:hypothetical protein